MKSEITGSALPEVVGSSKIVKDIIRVSNMLRQNTNLSEINIELEKEGYYRAKRSEIVRRARIVLASEHTMSMVENLAQKMSNCEKLYQYNVDVMNYAEARKVLEFHNQLFIMFQNEIEDGG